VIAEAAPPDEAMLALADFGCMFLCPELLVVLGNKPPRLDWISCSADASARAAVVTRVTAPPCGLSDDHGRSSLTWRTGGRRDDCRG
jgi:hypothetical protein